jgi:hypothetical protein
MKSMIKENENLRIREDVIKIKEDNIKDTILSIGEEKPFPSGHKPKPAPKLDTTNNNPLKPVETQKDIGKNNIWGN